MRRRRRRRRGTWPLALYAGAAALVLVVLAVILLFFRSSGILSGKSRVEVKTEEFRESSRALRNPNRGFYNIYQFMITDDETDYHSLVTENYKKDTDTSLTLIEVNLQNYRDGEISEAGLTNIESLFCALASIDKQLIVRFLYDWEGENERYEPENMDIILRHMEQLETTLRGHRSQIFSLQGLLIGNWGEMNSSQYYSDLNPASYTNIRQLAGKLADVTDESTYLAVRMPTLWRTVTEIDDPGQGKLPEGSLAARLGLFNDGMLSSESDSGTYGTEDSGGDRRMRREDELDFQDRLCRLVPNGGEVINDNSYNDFDCAAKDLAVMHVTYLNEGYDQEVYDKWADTVVTEEGCYKGMDGLTYMERHLGYRLLIDDVDLKYNSKSSLLSVTLEIKNVGFAPLYWEPAVRLFVYDEEEDSCLISCFPEGSLCSLAGGKDADNSLKLKKELSFCCIPQKKYTLYICLEDPATEAHILLANEQEEEQFADQYGYRIGTVEVIY